MKRYVMYSVLLILIMGLVLMTGCSRSGEAIPPDTLRYALE